MSTSAPRGTGELSLRARPHLASTACALRQHPASTPCVNSLRQHPASTPCCSQGPLQRKSSISFVPGAHYKGNLQFPLFPEPTTKEICNFLCSQGTILRQHPASTAGVHRCPKLTPVPNRRFPDLQPIYKVARNCSGKGEALWSNFGLPVGAGPRHLCQHLASTLCVNSRSP